MGVTLKTIDGFAYQSGSAYIALPGDIERDIYVRDCYKNFHVSIRTEDGGFYNRVPIPENILSFIDFPNSPRELGSCVIFSTDEKTRQPYIVAKLADRELIGDGKEYKFSFRRVYKDQFVEVSGSPKEKALNLIAQGGNTGSKINLIAKGDGSVATIEVDGEVRVNTIKGSTFVQEEKFVVVTQSDDDTYSLMQQTSSSHQFKNKFFVINDGKEPFVLGKQLSLFLQQLKDVLTNLQTVDQKPLSPQSITQISELFAKTDTILSQVGYIDK